MSRHNTYTLETMADDVSLRIERVDAFGVKLAPFSFDMSAVEAEALGRALQKAAAAARLKAK